MAFYDELIAATEAERNGLLSIPFIRMGAAGQLSRESYLAFLGQAYHHVKHTVPLLMATGGRLPERLEWLREAIGEYIEEEMGHQEWILNDIEACGADKEAVRNAAGNIEQSLGLPKTAFSYLNSHGSLDIGHVDFYEGLMNRLDEDADKQAVVHGAKMFYKLYGDIFRSLPLIRLEE